MNAAFILEHDCDQEPTRLTDLAELDQLLDDATAAAIEHELPTFVDLTSPDERRTLDIGIGRPDYSVLIWHDDDLLEINASQGTMSTPEDAAFDYGGTWTSAPLDSAIPVELARQAAREFMTTGQRPTCVEWQEPCY